MKYLFLDSGKETEYTNRMNTNKIRTKAVSGPGGIRCPCCNNMGSVKAARTTHNRIIRRAAKQTLKVALWCVRVSAVEINSKEALQHDAE